MANSKIMTVRQLRAYLAHFDEDLEVFATWESLSAPISIGNFEISEDENRLNIDVEDYE